MYANKVFIFHDDWSYFSYKKFAGPAYMITIGNSLFMTGEENIWKLDENLNVLNRHVATGTFPGYRELFYNSTNQLLYIAPHLLNVILVFDLNLVLNHSISTASYSPFSVAEDNNKMFVGTTNGTILVVLNKKIIKHFSGCHGKSVILSSIFFDRYGFIATSCSRPTNALFLYYSNGSFTNKSISAPYNPKYIGFDSKGRFVLVSWYQINIYS